MWLVAEPMAGAAGPAGVDTVVPGAGAAGTGGVVWSPNLGPGSGFTSVQPHFSILECMEEEPQLVRSAVHSRSRVGMIFMSKGLAGGDWRVPYMLVGVWKKTIANRIKITPPQLFIRHRSCHRSRPRRFWSMHWELKTPLEWVE